MTALQLIEQLYFYRTTENAHLARPEMLQLIIALRERVRKEPGELLNGLATTLDAEASRLPVMNDFDDGHRAGLIEAALYLRSLA